MLEDVKGKKGTELRDREGGKEEVENGVGELPPTLMFCVNCLHVCSYFPNSYLLPLSHRVPGVHSCLPSCSKGRSYWSVIARLHG